MNMFLVFRFTLISIATAACMTLVIIGSFSHVSSETAMRQLALDAQLPIEKLLFVDKDKQNNDFL